MASSAQARTCEALKLPRRSGNLYAEALNNPLSRHASDRCGCLWGSWRWRYSLMPECTHRWNVIGQVLRSITPVTGVDVGVVDDQVVVSALVAANI